MLTVGLLTDRPKVALTSLGVTKLQLRGFALAEACVTEGSWGGVVECFVLVMALCGLPAPATLPLAGCRG